MRHFWPGVMGVGLMIRNPSVRWKLIAAIIVSLALIGHAQSTTPATTPTIGPLQIHVTAVQGGAQYRQTEDDKWQAVKEGLDLIEGAEFRTGPKGAIQFTVGTDQVFRVDRLSRVKVLRAALMPDGTIHTDVGMTYGRISKDVDEPERTHLDTIVSPSSTLAIRGTRVSLYDQPPYAPEAVSLTGAAEFQDIHGQLVRFGAKGEGKAKVRQGDTSAAQDQLAAIQIDPKGEFAGRTDQESQLLQILSAYGGNDFRNLGVFQFLAGEGGAAFKGTIAGALPDEGQLIFALGWTGLPQSVVNFAVTDPSGQTVSFNNQSVPDGGMFLSGTTQAPNGRGQQVIEYGLNPSFSKQFQTGTYTTSETLQTPGTATATLEVEQVTFPRQIEQITSPQPIVDTLNTGQTVTHSQIIPVPVTSTTIVTGGARRK
jgi:hypothetical protein